MRQKLYIETSALTAGRLSGVGHTLLFILRQWQQDAASAGSFDITLLVPFDKKRELAKHGLKFKVKALPLPDIMLRMLRKWNMLPPLDLVLGRATYLFPNYWNWPLARSRSLTYVYDVSFLAHPEFTEPKNRRFLSGHLPVWLKRTDAIVTISEDAKQEILRYYPTTPGDKIVVIYNGVDVSFYKAPGANEIAATQQRYGIAGAYFLFVGNIEPRKNLSKLIAAYRLLPQEARDNYSLIFIGGGGWNNEPIMQDIAKAQQDGLRVKKINTFVPNEDMPALYAGATALAHVAVYEGFGMTPLEAMACGTPVVAGDIRVLREVLGDAALFADPTDERAIANALRKVLAQNVRQGLAAKGAARAKQFAWGSAVRHLADAAQGLHRTQQ